MFPTEVQIPYPLALNPLEHRLPWPIRRIASKRKRRARPVHTEGLAWTIRGSSARENGLDPWQRLQSPGFWCPCANLDTAFPTEKCGKHAGAPLLYKRRIPQALQAVVGVH